MDGRYGFGNTEQNLEAAPTGIDHVRFDGVHLRRELTLRAGFEFLPG